VLPLLVVSGLLAYVGLTVIAVALLAVEGVVALAVLVARCRPERPKGAPKPWLVPVTMAGVLLVLVALTLAAARVG
jgi:hypothetical protein